MVINIILNINEIDVNNDNVNKCAILEK